MVDKELPYVPSLELEPASQHFEHLVGTKRPILEAQLGTQNPRWGVVSHWSSIHNLACV